MSAPFALAAGGTGGHLFPAEALAGELAAGGRQVHLLTDSRIDSFAAQIPGVTIHKLRAGRLGARPVRTAYALGGLAAGAVQARRLLRRLMPAAVIGFGGYPSVPTMLAAASLGLPTLIHEQNAVLGRANRLLAPRVWRIATGFAETAGLRRGARERAVHTGNPVRRAILALGDASYSAPEPDGAVELLVLGGSQGAHILAEIVPTALARLPQAAAPAAACQPAGPPRRSRRGRYGLSRSRGFGGYRELFRRRAATAGTGASGHLPRRGFDRRRTRRRSAGQPC